MEPQREYSFTVLYEAAEEGGYVVACPALPGLVTEGDTLEEAREMARDAIRAYLESLRKDGLVVLRLTGRPNFQPHRKRFGLLSGAHQQALARASSRPGLRLRSFSGGCEEAGVCGTQ
jgi:predicted RNase H-like HicB family nuclease